MMKSLKLSLASLRSRALGGTPVKPAFFAATILAANLLLAQSPAPRPPSQPQNQTPGATGKPPIRTKTTEEFKAYQTAIANSLNPPAMEKAADDFAAKFPSSDVRVLLYRTAMSSYQSIGESQKMMDMGMKVLAIDKDDPEALLGVAEVLEEHTAPTDLDRRQREQEVLDYANHALATINTDLAVPEGTPPEKVESYRRYLRSTCLAVLGTTYYKQENYPLAEAMLRAAIDTDPANPDAVVVLRLSLALDQQKKYNDALTQANRAVGLTKEDSEIGRMARNERDRLQSRAGPPPPPAAQPKSSNPEPAAPPAGATPGTGSSPSH
ncbi:MAG: tetratricopeptide repeat protein [Acidobacteria bacterium]|nr:tetratricopeptide repeat protein [Acidobacteriota bacterium]